MKNALLVLTVLAVGGWMLAGCGCCGKTGSGFCGICGEKEKPVATTVYTPPSTGSAYVGETCPESKDYWADLEPKPAPKPAGMARVDVKTGITSVNYRIDVANVDNITGAFIHLGNENGKLGPTVVTLYKGEAKTGSGKEALSSGSITADKLSGPLEGKDLSMLADEIRKGNAFVVVTTTDRPDGVLVGKLGYNEPSDTTRSHFTGEQGMDKSGGASENPKDTGDKPVGSFFTGEDRGPMFMAMLTPPKDMPDAKAHLWLGSNKAMDELRYRLMLKDVKNPTGANLYLVETPTTKPADKGLGEPIAKLRPSGDIKEGAFTGSFADGRLTKDDLMGALKGKDLSTLIDHIRAGHVYVAVMTDTYQTGQFQGVLRLSEKMEKDTDAGTTP